MTTITGFIKEADGMIYAASRLGLDGIDYKDEWFGKQTTAGSIAHDMVECFIKGEEWKPDKDQVITEEVLALAKNGFSAFQRWFRDSMIEMIDTEMNLVSEKWQFGGCPDALGKVDGRNVLLDWKTGAVYPPHLMQVAAYKNLVEENVVDFRVDDIHIVRIDKKHAGFVHYSYPMEVFDKSWTSFQSMRRLYEDFKYMKGVLK